MRILQVCPKYQPSLGGIEEQVKNVSERLAKEHEVTVFACDPSGKLPKQEAINGVLVERFRSFCPSNAYYISPGMAKRLKKSEFDVVHGHSYHALPLYFARYAKAKRFIVTPHYHRHGHTSFRDFLIRLYRPSFGRRIFDQASRVIAVSEYEKRLLIDDFTIDTAKLSVIPNGVDSSEYSNQEVIPKEPRSILYVGRLEEYKGIQYIIETLPLLDRDYHLEVVGDGSYEAHLVAQTRELGLNDRVRFYHDLPRPELLERYARAGVFVLLSRYEAFGLTVAEALASRTPCIVANTSALSEWVDDKNCFGIRYPIDRKELAGLIDRVAGATVGDVRLWDWDMVVAELIHAYLAD